MLKTTRLAISIFPLLLASPALHAGVDEDSLMRAFGDGSFISIATGSRQPISLAPAVASVVTSEDIRAIGARDLDEVLQSIPGLHVSVAPRGYLPLYTIRGIYSEHNPQVLMLINNIPVTNLYVGNRGELWGGMPVNDIARIEIIRGPGSAIYGADAFAGVINIITKSSDDIGGTETGGRVGSFSTKEGWILHGGNWRGTDIAMSLQAMRTDGHGETIDIDYQSLIDNLVSTDISHAPGPVNLDRKNIDARIDLSRGDWRLRLGYQGREGGVGAGVAFALDPEGKGKSERYNVDLSYETALSQYWDFSATLSYFDTSAETDLILFPPGHISGGFFPIGVIAQPYVYERHTRFNISAFFHGLDSHSIRIGAGAIHGDMYKIRERKNYQIDPVTNLPTPLPSSVDGNPVDVSNDASNVFIQPNDRTVAYAFVQDVWRISSDWNLTGGVRFDDYSDFGSTTNPRLALVWQSRPNLTTKLLYGRAFRAPAFNELYNINNPVALGNPYLKPEEIDTYEIAFTHIHSSRFRSGLNLYHYKMTDIIRFIPDPSPASTVTARNSGSRKGYGMEMEAKYDVTDSISVTGNYAFQKATESDTDTHVANAPRHQIYIRANWEFIPGWSINAQTNWVSDRKRDVTDPRSEIEDYLLTDLTLRYQRSLSSWEFALSGRNILDEDAFEPSPAPGTIPNDLPLAGRHFFVEARYHWDSLRRN